MSNNKYKAVTIDALNSYFEEHQYYIRNVFIEEELSEVTKTTVEIVVTDKKVDLWNLNIAVSAKWSVLIQYWKQQDISNEKLELIWSRHIHGVVAKVNTSGQYIDNEYYGVITVELRHPLFLLSYSQQYNISNYSSHGMIVSNLASGGGVHLVNTSIPMQLAIYDLFIQFGEGDLHLFERLVQSNGAFYLCDDSGYTVAIHDTTAEYKDGNHYLMSANRDILGRVFTISMEQIQVPMEYTTIDYDYKDPGQLYGITLNISGVGKWTDYPAMRANGMTEIQTELQAINMKKRFVNRKYTIESSCYDVELAHKITIDQWSNKDPHVVIKISHSFSFSKINHKFTYYNTFVMQQADNDCYVSNKSLIAPVVSSVQTATVMAISPIFEIETNASCEVFIQFHWVFSLPQMGGDNMASLAINQAITAGNILLSGFSCWVPVAQILAGTNYGSFIVPRVGDEVLVYFLDGNPNRPIVFGGIYNKTQTSYYAEDLFDQFKIVLMRSKTFYDTWAPISYLEPNTYNEISMTDIPFAQKIYMKAQKNIEFELGMMTSLVPSDFKTSISGIGSQSHDIMLGDYSLNILLGNEKHVMQGNCSFEVNPGKTGESDFSISVTMGKLNIDTTMGSEQKYIKDVDVEITMGDLNITVEGAPGEKGQVNIKSTGAINLTSEDSINLVAPNINFTAEETIALKAANNTIDMEENIKINTGENIEAKVGGDVKVDVAENMEIKTGASIKGTIGENLELETLGALKAQITEECNVNVVGAIKMQSAEEIGMKAAMGFKVEAGMECEIKSGLSIAMEAGLECEIKSGLSLAFKSGLEMEMSSGLSLELKSGLEAAISAGLMGEIKAGLMLGSKAGLMAEIQAGLMIDGVAGLMVDLTGGLGFDAYANAFISGESAAMMFCLIPG